ncbi:MAG: EamA family transporter [Thermoleophilia bacterium]
MLAALLAVAASFFWGTGDLLAGLAGRRASSWSVTLAGHGVGLCVGVLVLLFLGRPWPGFEAMLPSLLAGFALAFGAVAYFTALAVGTMSVVAPIASAGAVVPVALGLGRGEQPSMLQAVGVAAAVIGVGLAVYERNARRSVTGTIEVGVSVPLGSQPDSAGPRNRLAALLAVFAAVLFGLTMVGFAETAKYDPLWPAVGGRFMSVAVLLVLVTVLRGRLARLGAARGGVVGSPAPRAAREHPAAAVGYWLPAGARLKAVAAGLFHLTAATLFSVASTKGLLSLVSVLSSLAAVFTVGLAFLFFGERLERQQLGGVVLALAGVLAIAGG